MRKQRLIILISCLFSLVILGTSVYSDNSTDKLVNVQILGINDFHGQLNTYQELNGQKVGGAEFIAAHIKKLQKEQEQTILVHAGDMVGGSTPVSALYKDEPTIEFLNQLKVDIGTLGNHEFDQGVQELNRLLEGDPLTNYRGTTTNYLSANVINKQTNEPLLPPYAIKKIDGIKIGFIGVLTTETNDYVISKNRDEVKIIDEISAINQAADQLIEKGVKAIIVLAHIPAKSNLIGGNPEEALVEMSPYIHDEVDVIFAGHNHSYANTLVDNKLIVQGYSYGKAISQVQLKIDSQSGEIVNKEANIRLTTHNIEPDKETMKLVNKYESMLSEKLNEVITTIPQSISRKKNEEGKSLFATLVATAMMSEMDSDMAFIHHGGFRMDLNKGEITAEDIYRSLPFNHKVVKINLTGSQIKKVLEQQWKKDKENLLQPLGISYTINREASFGKKIEDMVDLKGEKINSNKVYSVAISDYLAFGGDGFTFFKDGKIILSGEVIRDVFTNYLKSQKLEHNFFATQ